MQIFVSTEELPQIAHEYSIQQGPLTKERTVILRKLLNMPIIMFPEKNSTVMLRFRRDENFKFLKFLSRQTRDFTL